MNIPAHAAIHLLHQCASGTLATHSREPAGYPYPSMLPYVTDAAHRPVLLVSQLAEHTRNFRADPRVGFAVSGALETPAREIRARENTASSEGPSNVTNDVSKDVLSGPRLTLIGRIEANAPDAYLVRRYSHYQPDAERYLGLGDFFFVTLVPERLRYIGGFGVMGWLDVTELDAGAPLDSAAEEALLEQFGSAVPDGVRALGIDRFGVDLQVDGVRMRDAFEASANDADALARAVLQCAARRCKTA